MKRRNDDSDISFLGKIILFFKTLKEKLLGLHLSERFLKNQREIAGYENENSPYEAKLSFGFGIASRISLALLCIILAVVLIFGGSIISYENVYYMFKDISYISSFSEGRPETLSFSKPFSNQDFGSFKNGLAVAGDSEIKFFTSTGRTTLVSGSGYTNPKICTSNSYALIYDQGRRSFSVYNSFISVHSETLDYPVSYADMAPDGSFCVVSKSNDYGSVVRIYDNSFKLESQYSKNDYIISAEMSPNGKYVAVLSMDAEGGESKVSLAVLKRGESKPLHTELISGILPYRAEFLSDDRIALICSDNFSVYDLNGNRKNNFVYPCTPEFISISEGNCCFLFNENGVSNDNVIVSFDSNGNLKNSTVIGERVTDMRSNNKYVFLLCEGKAVRVDLAFGATVSTAFDQSDARLVIFSNGEVVACTENTAYYISFN